MLCRASLEDDLPNPEPRRVSLADKDPVPRAWPDARQRAARGGLAEGLVTSSSERQAGGTRCHPTVSKQGRDPATVNGILP